MLQHCLEWDISFYYSFISCASLLFSFAWTSFGPKGETTFEFIFYTVSIVCILVYTLVCLSGGFSVACLLAAVAAAAAADHQQQMCFWWCCVFVVVAVATAALRR